MCLLCRAVLQDEVTAATVEGLMYSFTLTDPHQKGNPLVFVSAGFETLTGYSSAELLGVNCRVLQVGTHCSLAVWASTGQPAQFSVVSI